MYFVHTAVLLDIRSTVLEWEKGLVGLGKTDVDMYHCAYHYKYCRFMYVLCTIVVTHRDTSLTRTNQCNEVVLNRRIRACVLLSLSTPMVGSMDRQELRQELAEYESYSISF
jgi:hypothetical protein